MPFALVCCQLRFCFVLFFLHLCYYYLFFKAASLDGHMAFLVAIHYVIFYWKFCMQVWRINSSSSSSSSSRICGCIFLALVKIILVCSTALASDGVDDVWEHWCKIWRPFITDCQSCRHDWVFHVDSIIHLRHTSMLYGTGAMVTSLKTEIIQLSLVSNCSLCHFHWL